MPYRIRVEGVVQGVGFRPFIYRLAKLHSLKGYVKNLSSSVEILVSGKEDKLNAFLRDIEEKKPPLSRIDKISLDTWDEDNFKAFRIEKSGGAREGRLVIPPDIALCKDCLDELFDNKNRRYLYPFINCTNCGQRFSLIERTPYDRDKTSMEAFGMCSNCRSEYKDPLDRRYHAQTTSCEACGPAYFLQDHDGMKLSYNRDAIEDTARLLDEGKIIAIKGFGGFHLASKTEDMEVLRLRRLLGRKGQPFAIIASNVDIVRSFAHLSDEEERILTSFERPIMILRKKEPFCLSENLAPGLHTIGVMLPYSPLHHILFSFSRSQSFVMTSANLPDDPMVTDNTEAVAKLGFVDYFLMNDLDIINRIDDTVIRCVTGHPLFIRRSRGFVPLDMPSFDSKTTLSLGAELSNTFTLTKDGRATISQHIGNTHNYDALLFMEDAIERMKLLLGVRGFDQVFCDLHPKYETTQLASTFEGEIYQVQHHFAHALSLLGERKEKRAVVIACDGVGYGADGNIWGGEVLYLDLEALEFERIGHLEYQKVLGGDLAAYYPLRMTFSILRNIYDSSEFFEGYQEKLKYGRKEFDVIARQWETESLVTSSCGRFFDALASLLDISYERTYEGEPAIKLESAALGGENIIDMEVEITRERGLKKFLPWVEYGGEITGENGDLKVIKTTPLLGEAFDLYKRRKAGRRDVARSIIEVITAGLCEVAIDACKAHGVENLGFSGGCAYNEIMTRVITNRVKKEGFDMLIHEKIPPGDGGISFGQSCLSGVIE
ncbi:MAG: carbamoyltransferase HypF [Candidatus Syntrophoarchaeum sp.]|nr:carbamoyltransferase HypF [Candidatus Syntrophoarchaeum sp.]